MSALGVRASRCGVGGLEPGVSEWARSRYACWRRGSESRGQGGRAGHDRPPLLLAVVVALALCIGASSSARAADSCANGAQRVANNSDELPDCRAYEMVSSPYKEGFGVDAGNFTDDGIVSYSALGGMFAGNAANLLRPLYHAERSTAGWVTTVQTPPGTVFNGGNGGTSGESADLRSSVWVIRRRNPPEVSDDIYLRNPAGDFVFIGEGAATSLGGSIVPTPGVQGTSADLSHIIFNYGNSGDSFVTALREYVGIGNDDSPRAVSVDNLGNPMPEQICHMKTSDDGRVIVFKSDGTCPGNSGKLWARVAGAATVAVSGSECSRGAGDAGGVCNGLSAAAFEGSADDGSRVFFSTSQQLVSGDVDQSNDLYACDIATGNPVPVGSANSCAALTRVSSGAVSGARVESVVAVSDDGSRAYFVAQGVLAENPGAGDGDSSGPVAGAHNLYLWVRDAGHPAGYVRFVAGLDGDDDLNVSKAQMTPDGRYLVFQTANALVASDIDGGGRNVDVYRYDSMIGSLVRVSTSVSGEGGNAAGFDTDLGSAFSDVHASISADGGSIIFDTAEALSARDTDGVRDVYSWRDGQVSLISDGGGSALWISSTGRDIFFMTEVPLVPGDRDVIADIYDARIGGGFDVPQVRSCSGDACRGRVSAVPGLVGPSAPGSPSGGPVVGAPRLSLGSVSAGQRRRFAATGRIALAVTTNAAGTIAARAVASVGGRSLTVGSARRSVVGAGRVSLVLVLSKRARAQLAARGRLAVKVSVSHSKVALDRSVTLRLTHAKAKSSAKRSSGGSGAGRTVTGGARGQS